MNPATRKKLRDAGYSVGTADQFLGLTRSESSLADSVMKKQYVRLTKCQDVDTMATPDTRSLEGWLQSEIAEGYPVLILLTIRDGVRSSGAFRTTKVLDYDEETGFFVTEDHVFHIEKLPAP